MSKFSTKKIIFFLLALVAVAGFVNAEKSYAQVACYSPESGAQMPGTYPSADACNEAGGETSPGSGRADSNEGASDTGSNTASDLSKLAKCYPGPNGKPAYTPCIGDDGKPVDKQTAESEGSWWTWLNPNKWAGWIAVMILQIANLIVYLSGAILNNVIYYTVVKMSDNIEHAGAITQTWKVVRDVGNMGFIFVLLYAAIRTIIGQERGAQQLIVRIITVAILINFSLFFTKFVIDTSNVLSLMFYDAIAPNSLADSASLANWGIANSLLQPLRLQTIMELVKDQTLDGSKLLIVGVMGTIFALIAAFVLFAVAILFVIRFVVLVFVLALSPIAFLSHVLPGTGKYSGQWWDALINQSFFAPIYFFLTWIVIYLSRSLFSEGSGSLATAFLGTVGPGGNAQAGDVTILMNFMIIIAMLITSLTVAKDMASKTSGGVGKLTSWATGVAGGATIGIAAKFGRNTAGRAAQFAADSEYLKRNTTEGSFVNRFAARKIMEGARKTGGSSFDFRGTGLGGQLSAGKAGGKGGYADERKKTSEAEKKFAESLGASDRNRAKAEQRLTNAKNEIHTTSQFRDEYQRAHDRQRDIEKQKAEEVATKERALARFENQVSTGNANDDPQERKRLTDERNRAREEAAKEKQYLEMMENEGAEGYKKVKIDKAQRKVDEIKGIDDDRAKEILIERLKRVEGYTEEAAKKEANDRKSKGKLAAIKKESTNEGRNIGDERKKRFADSLQKSKWAKFRGYNYTAAALIRKAKSGKDKVAEAVKDMVKEEEPTEEATPAAPETSAAPSGEGEAPKT